MKIPKITSVLALITLFSALFTSCVKDFDKIDDDPNNSIYSNFDFKTTKELKLSINTLNASNESIGDVPLKIYSQNPLTSEGLLKDDSNDYLVFKGITSKTGMLNCKITTATYVDSLSILINHIGMPSLKKIKIDSNEMNIFIGGASAAKNTSSSYASKSLINTDPVKMSGYYVLGTWNIQGNINYFWNTNDKISNDFLADINASLPENSRLTVSKPEYLSSTDQGNIELVKDAEVWVTFVHEGAGYRNALGYYTHPTNTPPTSKSAITDATILFPNFSYAGSGGTLVSGNRVQLLYLDPKTNKYTSIFPAGTSVSWFLIANSFNGTTSSIGQGNGTYYSDVRFNPETNAAKKKHNVVLKDNTRELLLIGFEDINRESNSDEDFNDAIFYATVSPYSAVKTDNIKPISSPNDADKDGVVDSVDEYPNDPKRAFNNYYPSKDKVGTIAYEDLWPHKGDYDFNDLVVDYNFNQVLNADNKVVEVTAAITIRAVGASLKNAFSIEFNTTPNNVKSVIGQNLTNELFVMNSNGTEQQQSKAVVPIFENSFKALNYNGSIVNTIAGGPKTAPKTVTVKIEFITPIALTDFGTPPYNPFMVVGGVRGKEIHLPASAPTNLANIALFGTGDDNSNIGAKRYYMAKKSLPWAINIPEKFEYPEEKQDVTKGFLKFNSWAESTGFNFMDWYQNKSGYRDVSKLYKN